MGISWQTQVTLALMVVGGGYLAYVNRFPPFNEGGFVDQLQKYLPKSNKAPGENTEVTGDLSNDMIPGQPQQPFPIPAPGQGPMPSMDNHLPAKPTYPEYKVYNDYATALRMQYGQGNTPNLGGGGSSVYGDASLGTTPIDPNLLGLNGSQGSSQPPPYPFLPNPLTPNVGMMRPPPNPYQMFPPPMPLPPWLYQPIIPTGQPYWATWASHRPLPYIYSVPQLLSMDLGMIDSTLDGITINTFLEMGVSLNTIFPSGINLGNQYQIGVDLTEFVTVYLRLHKIKPARQPRHRNRHGIGIDLDLGNLGESINNMVKGIMDKVKGKLGGIGDIFGSSGSGNNNNGNGLGDLFGGMFNGSNTNYNIDNGNGNNQTSTPGPGTGLSGLFGNLFGGGGASNNNSSGGNNNNNFGNGVPNANSINQSVFDQLHSMGVAGFHARALAAMRQQGFNQKGSSSLQPYVKGRKHARNTQLRKVYI